MNPDTDYAGSKVVIKQGREQTDFFDVDLAEAVRAYRRLKADMAAFEPTIGQLKEQIVAKARRQLNGKGTVRFIVDDKPLKVTFGYACVIPEEHVAKVRELLGERFIDLVRVKTEYSGTQTLIDLASDADEKHPVRAYLVIKEESPKLELEK